MSVRAQAGGGPLTAVLAAFADGAHSLDDVAARCHLPLDTVRASVDHLVRVGRLEAAELALGCPPGGCGSCLSGAEGDTPECGVRRQSPRGAHPVLVTISLPRPWSPAVQPCTASTAPTSAAVTSARSSSDVT